MIQITVLNAAIRTKL